MINEVKLDEMLLELGHDDFNRGTAFIREGVKLYEAGHRALTKDLYPTIARAHESTASRVERAMRHSLGKAWGRAPYDTRLRYFGMSVSPDTGQPTVGEYVARMARICRED